MPNANALFHVKCADGCGRVVAVELETKKQNAWQFTGVPVPDGDCLRFRCQCCVMAQAAPKECK